MTTDEQASTGARTRLLSSREGLSSQQREVFDWIVESRGRMIRPYEVLLHAPGLARPAAELGHQIRYEGALSGHDRELAIITTAKVHGCAFEWESHLGLARDEGVTEATIGFLRDGTGDLVDTDELIVGFIRELCADSDVSDDRFSAIEAELGTAKVIELTALVGYYTFLGLVMRVAGAC